MKTQHLNAKESDSKKENTKKDGSSSAPPIAKNSSKGTRAAVLSQPILELKSTGLSDLTKAWVVKSFNGPMNSKPHAQTPAENTTPTHRSKRNVAIGDQDSTERAAKLKARKILEEPNNSGNILNTSFLSLSNDEVAHNISKVGFLLGSNVTSVSKSINNLKHVERSRLHVLPKQKELHASSKQLVYNLTDSEDELDLLAINQLCGEIAEVMSEGEASDLCDL